MLSIFLMEKRTLNFITRNNKFLDECFFRWASLLELSANERHEREDNNPDESAYQCPKHYTSKCKTATADASSPSGRARNSQSRGSRFLLGKASGRWPAFASARVCYSLAHSQGRVKLRATVRSFHVEIGTKGFQKKRKKTKTGLWEKNSFSMYVRR